MDRSAAAEQALDISMLRNGETGEPGASARRCPFPGEAAAGVGASGRACRVVGRYRSTQRYERVPAEYELGLVARMNELAAAHPRWGYRRVWSLLRSEGWRVNRKRIERLWRLEGHRVPPRRSQASWRRAQGAAEKVVAHA